MMRALRLVVDTGLHYKKWSREQAIHFFVQNSTLNEATARHETDRYLAWPAQARGYKVGQLQIPKLRQWATNELGEKFDLRAFHDTLLNGGALPLDVLERRIRRWVSDQKSVERGP